MALPGMDLQSQYNQTLQNTIGQSQVERLRQARQQQSVANTDWQQRGVADDAKRYAGFQEINPSEMPNMSSDTRSFIQPLLGTYQEGGRQVEGYYGKDNPYTQPGLENLLGQQGYARAPTSLSEQFKSSGLKLPNAYGQDYYNADYERLGSRLPTTSQQTIQADRQKQMDDLYKRVTASTADYQNRYGPAKASIEKYTKYGFTPGKDNGNWKWSQYNRGDDFGNKFDEEGAGYWLNTNGINRGVTYTPSAGFGESDFDHAATGFNKWMPAITMTALGAMFGGAGSALMAPEGAAAGSAATGGQLAGRAVGSAIPNMIQTGASTGDWGKALSTGGLNALAGGLGGYYGGDLAKTLGLTGKLGEGVARGLISSAVNTTGNALLGNKLDYKSSLANTLSNIAAPYLGEGVRNYVGGTGGDILGGAVGGFSGNALKNILQGKSLDIGTALSTLQGATGGLGRLFSNTNEDKQTVNGPTKLADTLQGVRNGPAATSRRT